MSITPKSDKDMADVIEKLIKRVTALEQGNALAGGVVIGQGGFTAVDPTTGNPVAEIGLGGFSDGSGRKQMRTQFNRQDGTIAFIIADLGTAPGHPFAQSLQMWDHGSHVWAADDILSGQGIARPYIPIGAFVDNTVPVSTTTSATFTTLQTLVGYKQHPKVGGQILVYADSGTTGTIQLVDQDANVLFTHTLASGEFAYVNYGPVALAGAHEASISLNIQGKVLTGAGKVGARGVAAVGVQS